MSELSSTISAPTASQTLDDFESITDLTEPTGIDLAGIDFDLGIEDLGDASTETPAKDQPSPASPEGQQDATGTSDDSNIVPGTSDAPEALQGVQATSQSLESDASTDSPCSPNTESQSTNSEARSPEKPLLSAEISAIEESIARLCLEEQRLKARAKSCKAEREELTDELASLLGRLEEPQRELPLSGDVGAADGVSASVVNMTTQSRDSLPGQLELPLGSDPGSKQPVSVLRLTENQIEIFASADIRTIGDLEQAMRDGRFTPGSIRGIGQTKIDTITDRLMEFRRVNPVPSVECSQNDNTVAGSTTRQPDQLDGPVAGPVVQAESAAEVNTLPEKKTNASKKKKAKKKSETIQDNDERPQPNVGQDSFEIDPAAYTAGCESAVNGEAVTNNPHPRGTILWNSWDRGWQDTSE